MEDLITPRQAGEILGVSRQLVQYYCLAKGLRHRKVGRLFLMLRKDVMQYKKYNTTKSAPRTVRAAHGTTRGPKVAHKRTSRN